MQRAMYPSPYMRITQGYGEGTHLDSFAIDEAGSDSGIDYLIAPFDCVVKKIWTTDANEVWVESLEPVLYADGTQDYMTIMFAHDNDVSNLWVGKQIKQGERFYEEGTKGNATGNHVHLECAKGKFSGTGWHQNSAGYWSINNGKRPEECLWIDDTYTIMDAYGYNWKSVLNVLGSPVSRDESKDQLEVLIDNLRVRQTPNGDILGYIAKGIYNYYEATETAGYWWYRIDSGWIATSTGEGWTKVYPKKEEEDPKMITELQKQLEKKEKEIQEQNAQIEQFKANEATLQGQITNLEEQLKDQPTLIFECKEAKDYKIVGLIKNDKLYWKGEIKNG